MQITQTASVTIVATAEELRILRFAAGRLSHGDIKTEFDRHHAQLVTPIYEALLNAERRMG